MFGRRITLFKLLGFEIRLDASWLLLASLITWSLAVGFFPANYPGLPRSSYWWMGVLGAGLLFGSIIVHELAHSVVARRYGIPMKGITLFIFGGVAEMDREPPNAKSEFLMAIAGPIASIVVGFVFLASEAAFRGALPTELMAVMTYLGAINLILAAFNMIPAFPLDGGRVLRAALWHWRGDLASATRTASSFGSAFGLFMMILAVLQLFGGNFIGAVWWFVIGMFLRMMSAASYQQVLFRSVLEGEPISRFMRTDVHTVAPDTTIDELVNDYFYRHHHRMLPVTDDGELVGCVTTEQVKNVPREQWNFRRVQDLSRECSAENTVAPDLDSMEALRVMSRASNTKLMVVEGRRLVGIVTLRDLMSFLTTRLELEGHGRSVSRERDFAPTSG